MQQQQRSTWKCAVVDDDLCMLASSNNEQQPNTMPNIDYRTTTRYVFVVQRVSNFLKVY